MAYIPHTESDRRAMLATIGVERIDDLYEAIPADVRFPDLKLPGPGSEIEVMAEMRALSEANIGTNQLSCFLGAGAYHHFVPSVVDHMLCRSEFYTAYTPYQPEISQGTLQVIFEYQSMICDLTGMDASNASHYDGGTSLAEAVIMAYNQHRGKRKRIIFSGSIHPQYREIVRTYFAGIDMDICGDDTLKDPAALAELINDDTALVAVQYPDFFGQVQDFKALGEAAHAAKALFCVVVNPLALALLKPPSEFGADIVVGEGQPLGISLSYGGPYLGIFATKQKYVRKIAGRLVGETVDTRGQRGYVLTLTPREQHIRRDKASSNICSNQGLLVLAAAVHMSALGKQGLQDVARLNYHKAHYAAQAIDALDDYSLWNKGTFFNEFVIACPRPVAEINEVLFEYGILGGYDLGKDYAEFKKHMLIAVTEMNSREEIDELVTALAEVTDA